MKATIYLGLLSLCQVSGASSPFVHSFQGDFQHAKVYPMLFLLRAVRANPKQNRFVISFQTAGPMSTYKAKVNFDRKAKRLYLLGKDTDGYESLVLFRNVTLEKISKCYHSTHLEQSGADNFQLLEDYGCPSQTLFSKQGPINGAD